MSDPLSSVDLESLSKLVRDFAEERDWVQFHQPKDLGLALASEVGELLDLFRFRPDAQVAAELATPEGHRAVAHELADCFWALLRLADVCGVDLPASLREKVGLAALKYPVEQSRGRNSKYTAYQPTVPPSPPGDDSLPGSA